MYNCNQDTPDTYCALDTHRALTVPSPCPRLKLPHIANRYPRVIKCTLVSNFCCFFDLLGYDIWLDFLEGSVSC